MKKRFLALFLALVMLCGMIPAASAAATPGTTVNLTGTTAYSLKGLAFNAAIQNMYIDTDYIYITQNGGSGTNYLSRLKIDGTTATYVDHMTFNGCGNGETLAGYYYNNKLYFFVGSKGIESTGYRITQIGRIQYTAGKTVSTYTELNRFTHMTNASADGSNFGNVYRTACCANEEYTIFRTQTEQGDIVYSCYDTVAINKLLDASNTVAFETSGMCSAFVYSFTQTIDSSNEVRPNGSFQGVELVDSNAILVSGGNSGETPAIAKMNKSGTYQYLAYITNVGTYGTGPLHYDDGKIYFTVVPSSGPYNDNMKIYYVDQSKLGIVTSTASYSTDYASVIEAASVVKANMDTGIIPSSIPLGNGTCTPEQFLYLACKATTGLSGGTSSGTLTYSDIAAPGSPSGTAYGDVPKSEYISMARSITAYIDAGSVAPNYTASSTIGNMQHNYCINMYAYVLDYYARYNQLPDLFTSMKWSGKKGTALVPSVPGVSAVDAAACTTLHQLPSVCPEAATGDYYQNMSYVIRTSEGKIIVIDGGRRLYDHDYLFAYLQKITGDSTPHVDAWFMTHAHSDHYGALRAIANDYASKITVDKFYHCLPTDAQVNKYFSEDDPAGIIDGNNLIYSSLAKLKNAEGGAVELIYVNPIHSGECNSAFDFDDVHVDILLTIDDIFWGVDNISTKYTAAWETHNAEYTSQTIKQLVSPNLNNASMVFRVTVGGKTILFTGDASTASNIMLARYHSAHASDSSKYYSLKSDYVQIAHHGARRGLTQSTYKLIDPDVAMWPTPYAAVYGVDAPKTEYPRAWIKALGSASYFSYTGPQVFSFAPQRSAAAVSIPAELKPLVFDAAYYAAQYPELYNAYGTDETALYNHFINYGIEEGRCASPYFDVKYYMNQNGEAMRETFHGNYQTAFEHFIANAYSTSGLSELSVNFDSSYYRSSYSDLSSLTTEYALLNHYVTVGEAEGRVATETILSEDGTTYHSPATLEQREATCVSPATTIGNCQGCGYSYTAVSGNTEVSGHSFTHEAVQPNCTTNGTDSYICAYCGKTFSYELEMPGEYHPTHDEKVLYFGFNNSTADQLRYSDNLIYGGVNFDSADQWRYNNNRASTPVVSNGTMTYNIAISDTGNHWFEIAELTANDARASVLEYDPDSAEVLEIRVKFSGMTARTGTTPALKVYYNDVLGTWSASGDPEANKYLTAHTITPEELAADGVWHTYTMEITDAHRALDMITGLRFELANAIQASTSGSMTIDYIYVGPGASAPSVGGDYLYFGFSASPLAEYRYAHGIYGGCYNFDKAGSYGDDWIFTSSRTPALTVADGNLNVTVGAASSESTSSPWLQTGTGNSVQAIMDYPTDKAELAEVRLKCKDLIVSSGTPSVCLSFVINDDATKETSDCNIYWTITEAQLASGEYLTFSADITDLLAQYDAERITSIRLALLQAGSKAGVEGSFSIDYIYVGSEADRPMQHYYDAVTTEPTCTEAGYTTYTCQGCGASYTADQVEALGHDYSTVVTEPTCTEAGFTTYTCGRCDYSYVADHVEALSHSYESVQVAATCTEAGYTADVCVHCGDRINYVETAAPTGHGTTTTVSYAATCTEDGYTAEVCTVCGEELSRVVTEPAKGHSFDESEVEEEPTCVEAGVRVYYCACGATMRETIPTGGHTYEMTVTAEATCTTDGTEQYTCCHCGDSYTVTIPAYGHQYDVNEVKATCTEAGYATYTCERCDYSYTETFAAIGHNFENLTVQSECTGWGYSSYVCANCTLGNISHNYGAYTPNSDSDVMFFGFDNTEADRARYTNIASYSGSGINYDTVVDSDDKTVTSWWTNLNYTQTPVIENGYMKYTSVTTTKPPYVQTRSNSSVAYGGLNFPASKAEVVQVRMKMEGMTYTIEDPKLRIILVVDDVNKASLDTCVVAFWDIPKEYFTTEEYFTATIPLEEYKAVIDPTTITAIRVSFNEGGSLSASSTDMGSIYLDYIYMGSAEKAPMQEDMDYLYFGFDGTEESRYRYVADNYGDHSVNFDTAAGWFVNTNMATNNGVADGYLKFSAATQTGMQYIQTATSTGGLNYPAANAEIVELRMRCTDMTAGDAAPTLRLIFLADDDADASAAHQAGRAVYYEIPTEYLTNEHFFTVRLNLRDILADSTKITAIRIGFNDNTVNSTGTNPYGAVYLDYLYVGPASRMSAQHEYDSQITTAPTCTEDGSGVNTCVHCGDSYTETIPATGHNYEYTNSGAEHTLTCANCGDSYTEAHSFTEGVCVCGAKAEELLSFKSATVTLESDLSMNFYVAKANLDYFATPYAVFAKAIYDAEGNVTDYEETTVTEYTEKTSADGTECYVFTFTGISAKEMGSSVTAVVRGSIDGTDYPGTVISYSVKQYAENLLAATANATLRTLLVDMLNYGAEAQSYFAYNTANLANAGLTDEQKAWASQEELSLMSSLSINDNEEQSVYFESAALLLEEKVTMNFYLDLDEYTGTMEDLYARVFFENANGDLVEYTIEGTELTELNGDHVLYFDGLNAAQMRSIIGVELYSRQMASCISPTLYYSIESYAHNKVADASLAELVTAMMRYGDSVAAYAAQ